MSVEMDMAEEFQSNVLTEHFILPPHHPPLTHTNSNIEVLRANLMIFGDGAS